MKATYDVLIAFLGRVVDVLVQMILLYQRAGVDSKKARRTL